MGRHLGGYVTPMRVWRHVFRRRILWRGQLLVGRESQIKNHVHNSRANSLVEAPGPVQEEGEEGVAEDRLPAEVCVAGLSEDSRVRKGHH